MAFDRVIDVKEGEVQLIAELVIITMDEVARQEIDVNVTANVIDVTEETDHVTLKNDLRWGSGGTFLPKFFPLSFLLLLYHFRRKKPINLRTFGFQQSHKIISSEYKSHFIILPLNKKVLSLNRRAC